MTTGAHSVWSTHRDGESPRKVGDDLRMTPVTTMGTDPDSRGGPNRFCREDSWELQRTQTASIWRFASKPAFAMINDQRVRSTGKSKMTEGNVTGTRLRAASVLPNDRKLTFALALIDAAQGRDSG